MLWGIQDHNGSEIRRNTMIVFPPATSFPRSQEVEIDREVKEWGAGEITELVSLGLLLLRKDLHPYCRVEEIPEARPLNNPTPH